MLVADYSQFFLLRFFPRDMIFLEEAAPFLLTALGKNGLKYKKIKKKIMTTTSSICEKLPGILAPC